jgi:ribosomal protein S18 acetylase RimI-like enzyme
MATLAGSLFRTENILIYAKDLSDGAPPSLVSGECRLIRKGKPDELKAARDQLHSPPWEFCCDLYDGVREFFIFEKDGKIGHISWLYRKGAPNRVIELGEKESEIKFSLTSPEYRGRGIYPAALAKMQIYLRDSGFRKVFICAEENNRPSIRGIEKAGFTLVSQKRLVKFMGLQLSRRYSSRS